MVFKFLRGEGRDRLDEIEARVQTMLRNDRHEVELAMRALLGDASPADVGEEIRAADQKVNRLEREIRRELVVHASVFGGIQSPAVLVYMSVVKDVERIGDYAKNLLDLAIDGANLSLAPDAAMWRELGTEVTEMITSAAAAFRDRDSEACHRIRSRGDVLLDRFDAEVSALIRAGDDPGAQAVARALAFRYFKRIVAHLMNLLSGVVMPLDRLDFFGHDPEDRDP